MINRYAWWAISLFAFGGLISCSDSHPPRNRSLDIVDFPPLPHPPTYRPADFFSDPQAIELVTAVQRADLATIDELVAAGADVDVTGKDGANPLTWALLKQKKTAFKWLLGKGANPNHLVMGGVPLVDIAARNGEDSEWLELLLKYKADPNVAYGRDRHMALNSGIYYATGEGQKRNLELLIHAGADLNHLDDFGSTPMLIAMAHNRYDMACRLLEAGADYRIKDKRERDLAYYVITSKFQPGTEGWPWREKLIDILAEKNADFGPSEAKVAAEWPEAFERWQAYLGDRRRNNQIVPK
jgi:ankyrin repeat protein